MLVLFSVLFGIFVYQSVLSKTIDLYKQNRALSVTLKAASDAPAKFQLLRKKLSSLDNVIQSRQLDSSQSVHDFLISVLSKYCKENNTILKSFPETSTFTQGNFEIQTNSFTVQGSFVNLLQLVYLLEQKHRTGKLSSVNFQSAKDMDSQKVVLTATVYLQTVKNIK